MAVIESKGNGYSLYNGVKLPSLPEYDKTAYPYVFLFNVGDTKFQMVVASMPWIMNDGYMTASEAGDRCNVTLKNDDITNNSFWGLGTPKEVSAGATYESYYIPIWANYDVLNADGSVYLAASEPISLDGMNVIEWDADITGLEKHPTVPAYLVSKATDVDVAKEIVFVTEDPYGVKGAFKGSFTENNGTYMRPPIWYVADASEAYPTSGVFILKNSSIQCKLFAYYPIEPAEPEQPEGDIGAGIKFLIRQIFNNAFAEVLISQMRE